MISPPGHHDRLRLLVGKIGFFVGGRMGVILLSSESCRRHPNRRAQKQWSHQHMMIHRSMPTANAQDRRREEDAPHPDLSDAALRFDLLLGVRRQRSPKGWLMLASRAPRHPNPVCPKRVARTRHTAAPQHQPPCCWSGSPRPARPSCSVMRKQKSDLKLKAAPRLSMRSHRTHHDSSHH